MSSTTPGGSGGSPGPAMADLDHGDLRANILASAFATWFIALVFVSLRFWTRARIVHALGPADWCIALSLVASLGMCISYVEEVRRGMGKHIWDIDLPNNFAPMMEAWWFSLLCYVLSLALTKVSICLLYLTIFTFEWARRSSYVVLAVVVITNLWAIATTLTYCIPLEAAWNPAVVASFCQSQDAWWANTGLVIATDLMIFILPIPIVLPLKLPRRQKLVVVGIFTIGFFVCVISLIRLIILIDVKRLADLDFTYTGTTLTYLTVIEVHTAIVVACAMTLKPLVSRFFPRLLDPPRSSGRSSTKDEGGPSAAAAAAGGSGGRPPLTIGSKPSRQVGSGQRQGGDGILGDVEQGGYGGGGREVEEKRVEGKERMEVSPSERSTIKNGKLELVSGATSPWMRGDAASERTEDLGREATARSIG